MATSSSPASSSPANSGHGDKSNRLDHHHERENEHDHDRDHDAIADSVPVETLVEHLLAAKRSLSSMTLVLHANSLSNHAHQLHEESVILGAQTAFLRRGIADQHSLLKHVCDGMIKAHDVSKREFRILLSTMDAAGHKLDKTAAMLKNTTVDSAFRPKGEEPKNLMDFVDEEQDQALRNAMFACLSEMQVIQTAYNRDLYSFESELRELHRLLASCSSSPPPRSSADSLHQQHLSNDTQTVPIADLLSSMTIRSHSMAEHLASLTRHFDLCVTAVRITEGGAALARRKAAEDSGEADPVSISGVIAEQEANVEEHDAEEKTDIVKVVLQDAAEVEDVVADLNAEMLEIEMDFNFLKDQVDQVKAAYGAVTQAFQMLEDIGSRLSGYIAAEAEYTQRWQDEKQIILGRLEDMDNLRIFYEGYASAYDSLILEVERRRAIEDKIQGIWRKAKDAVDKLVESDWRDRETFRAEVGEYIPTDLWVGMSGPLRRWDVVPSRDGESSTSATGKALAGEMPKQQDGSTATLNREIVDAARERARLGSSAGN